MNHRLTFFLCLCTQGLCFAATPQQIEFFENKIRPVLAQECYECHGANSKRKGGLLLDSRPGWQEGGDSGALLVPGDPAASLLIQTLRHQHPDLQMPKNGAQLDEKVLLDFERWVREGAPDPRDHPPSPEQLEAETNFAAVMQRRKQWWSFQPLPAPPANPLSPAQLAEQIDRRLDEQLAAAGLVAAPLADAATLRRRLSLVLTGLPPVAGDEVDLAHLLHSNAYAEKWARHWLDWVRYAESYGSEGDPGIPYASQYRDYVIRAFAGDVSYFQLVREAIAGDLLPEPRIHNGVNESALGVGQLRMVLHGFQPTDALEELVTWTDNQIDTVSKAFLGLTVSCARCHDHKFDPISQADFYALYGIFTSTRPAVIDVNTSEDTATREQMKRLKDAIKRGLIEVWQQQLPEHVDEPGQAAEVPAHELRWNPASHSLMTEGRGAVSHTAAGEFRIALEGDLAVEAIHPSGSFTNLLSTRDRAVLLSANFRNAGGKLWIRAAGAGGAKLRYTVHNFPRPGGNYGALTLDQSEHAKLRWHSFNLDYWTGDDLHLEFTTAADHPTGKPGAPRSWFGIADALLTKDGQAPTEPILPPTPDRRALRAWAEGTLTDVQAETLDAALHSGLLTNQLADLGEVAPLVQKYRKLEADITPPQRAPGVLEGEVRDAALFVSGVHKNPGDLVPRRFLEALDAEPFATSGSGRLELADKIVAPDNPLTARVIVNRIWQNVFGQGLVPTTDNFGKLGQTPSHPELLDFLSAQFIADSGSIRRMVQALVSTRAFARAAVLPESQMAMDPDNRLLARWTARRMDAEMIRDSLLKLSGGLRQGAPAHAVNGDQPWRSIYVQVQRNRLDPFLTAFDFPVPSESRARRDATNVPAQSLMLMNDPAVLQWSEQWVRRHQAVVEPAARVGRLFLDAYGREPQPEEVTHCLEFVKATSDTLATHPAGQPDKLLPEAWTRLGHALINSKEFIYLR